MMYHSKSLYYAFLQYLNQLRRDAMLVVVCIAPILCGLFFRYGIPFIQHLLIQYLERPDILPPYYLLFDLLLISLTPLLYNFASAYVILGEIDDGISKYLAVTPIGKKGYLITRLGIPTLIAIVVSIIVTSIFNLTEMSINFIILISFMSGLLGMIEALLIVAISSNKVEGMAVSKLSGLFILGLPLPFFIAGKIQYLLFFLPTFWLSKFAIDHHVIYVFFTFIIGLFWNITLYQKFKKKIM